MLILGYGLQPVEAKPVQTDAVLVCYSGGQEIVRKTVVEGPFADEYKFAHEVKVIDEQGEHQLNFAGGLCMIDRGAVALKSQPKLSDRLSCYSGGKKVIDFEVYGRETTVDEYLEGRTFVAKARGKAFNYDSLHQYLVFGGGACLGEET
ncbi:hypothetical protein [Stanieria cyanosphaera]